MEGVQRHRPFRGLALLLPVLIAICAASAATAGAAPPPSEFFGLQAGGAVGDASAIQKLGVHVDRVNFELARIQPIDPSRCGSAPDGAPDWTRTDDELLDAARHQIRVLAEIFGQECGFAAYPTRGTAEYENVVNPQQGLIRDLVARYGVGGTFWKLHEEDCPHCDEYAIRVWELGNEPNYRANTPGGAGADPIEYAKYMIDGSKAIRAAQPSAVVLNGGLAGIGGNEPGDLDWARFLNSMYAANGVYTPAELSSSFDGLSIHPYALENNAVVGAHAEAVIQKVKAAETVLEADTGNREKPIYVTEVGWPVAPLAVKDPMKSHVDGESDDLQAADILETFTRLYQQADSLNVKYAGVYLLQDASCGAERCEWPYRDGLINLSGEPRPSWCAFSHVTGSNLCQYVPPVGFETATSLQHSVQLGQPGTVHLSGEVRITNIAGEEVNGASLALNLYRVEGEQSTFVRGVPAAIVNGRYEVNAEVGVGDWEVQAVLPTHPALHLDASHSAFQRFANGYATASFVRVDATHRGQPGSVSVSGHVNVTSVEGGPVSGQTVNVNFSREVAGGGFEFKSSAHPTVVNGEYSVSGWPVSVGNWRVRTVFPEQWPFRGSESDFRSFSIAK
jgi:hypothetical protein